MSNIISETFYGSHEPQWLVESPKEAQSHFDRRGCVRQIRTSSYRSNSNVHTPGRTENLPKRPSYPSEQPPMVNADRQAYVYNAVPATHRTVDRPTFNSLNRIVSDVPIVEFMVPLCCGKCEEKVKEELENVVGVYKVVCDQHNQRVTVSSTIEPQRLLKRVKRVKKNSHFWSGSSYLRNVHHVQSLPSDHFHRSLVRRSDIPAYKPESAHHRSTSRISDQHQRYVSPRSSYDPVETQYLKRKPVGRSQAEDPEFYYVSAEHQYKSHGSSPFRVSLDASQGYTTGTAYVSNLMDNSLRYRHLPSSYGPAYEYPEDYALSSTECY